MLKKPHSSIILISLLGLLTRNNIFKIQSFIKKKYRVVSISSQDFYNFKHFFEKNFPSSWPVNVMDLWKDRLRN